MQDIHDCAFAVCKNALQSYTCKWLQGNSGLILRLSKHMAAIELKNGSVNSVLFEHPVVARCEVSANSSISQVAKNAQFT